MVVYITEKNESITYKYNPFGRYDLKNAVQEAFQEVYNKTSKNKEIFNDLRINIFKNWEESPFSENFSDGRMGFTKYPVGDIGKNIYLQTNEYDDINSSVIINNKITRKEAIRETAIHEFGHLFDFYFANPDEDVFNRLREIILSGKDYVDKHDKEYRKLLNEYCKQNGLSDSEKFKQAWKEDVENTFKGKYDVFALNTKIQLGYFSPTHSYDNKLSKIKTEDGINDKELLLADRAREEIFAQLFAYAMGEFGDKKEYELIIKTYPKCYETVKEYIGEYLGINLTDSNQKKLDIDI